ncbi:MAG: hypothetical protein HOF94_03050 [Alphaproteobacteria bacterium]|jgi:hypothetical protein|nr:hypothetical protein [Alphaproteobacteria bacterium]
MNITEEMSKDYTMSDNLVFNTDIGCCDFEAGITFGKDFKLSIFLELQRFLTNASTEFSLDGHLNEGGNSKQTAKKAQELAEILESTLHRKMECSIAGISEELVVDLAIMLPMQLAKLKKLYMADQFDRITSESKKLNPQ